MPSLWLTRQLDRNVMTERLKGGPWHMSPGGVPLLDSVVPILGGLRPQQAPGPEFGVAREYTLTTQNWLCLGRFVSPPLVGGQDLRGTTNSASLALRAQVSANQLTAQISIFGNIVTTAGTQRAAFTTVGTLLAPQLSNNIATVIGSWSTTGGITGDGDRIMLDVYARLQASMAGTYTVSIFADGASRFEFAPTVFSLQFLPEPEVREVISLHVRESADFIGGVSTAPQSVTKVDGGSNARPNYNRDMQAIPPPLALTIGRLWPRQISQVGAAHLYGGKFMSPPITTDVIPGQMISAHLPAFTSGNGVLLWARPTVYVVTPQGAVRAMLYDSTVDLAPGSPNTSNQPVTFTIPGVVVEPGDRLVMEFWIGVSVAMSGTWGVDLYIWTPNPATANARLEIEDLWYVPEVPPVTKIWHDGDWREGSAKGWTGNAWAPVKIRHEGEWKEVVKP